MQPTKQEKVLASQISDKELISTMYKVLQLNTTTINIQFKIGKRTYIDISARGHINSQQAYDKDDQYH